ncbi:alpha-1,3-mannosyltransferase MNN1 SCDLUD_005185 [Saccharomycodes ludwigii]|uniref:alpha-1,3-mannosyltransferase MNN1 n=1 Tax=Saccharomycodes ludwigii TaxID=36035 RepID=UPI001E875EF0|nr:hypothetical protein SCDLUD_005185 [Saccharomycodes ludwigii]KAH3898846.1 hypothetical protein SCDLUD_005185 [Saccharomycodes ludwigii]
MKYIHRLFVLSAILLILIFNIIYFNDNDANQKDQILKNERHTIENSYFSPPSKKYTDKERKCHNYFLDLYMKDLEWSHGEMRIFHNYDILDDNIMKGIMEHLRIYTDCYLHDNDLMLPTEDFPDLEYRLFPFLNPQLFTPFIEDNDNKDDSLIPKVYDTRKNLTDNIYSGILTNNEMKRQIKEKYGKSFWKFWRDIGNLYNEDLGSFQKGITMTMGPRHVTLLYKLLHILDLLGNELPIQIIFTALPDGTGNKDSEFDQNLLSEISKNINERTNQHVYFVDCGDLLNPDYITNKSFAFFIHKWLAMIFNTFEEALFLDVDAIPFVKPADFFELKEYQSTGAVLFRDRRLENEHTFEYCINMFNKMIQTETEEKKWKHPIPKEFQLDTDDTTADKDVENKEFHKVYYEFFHKTFLHHIDSGLVVMNRKKKLNSLLSSFILNLSAKASRCVYGDKEMFWLGPLFQLDTQVSIIPSDGAVVGSRVQDRKTSLTGEDEQDTNIIEVCGTQLAHIYPKNKKILWTNGGLKTCKMDKVYAAASDYSKDGKFFDDRFQINGDLKKLEEIYDKALNLEYALIPDVTYQPWVKNKECMEYSYCAYTNPKLKKGTTIKFKKKEVAFLNSIATAWNDF